MLLSVLRHADSVKIACVSELVNCISHIRTRNQGGCWVLPPYYAFLHYTQYGRGTALLTKVNSDVYDSKDYKDVPYLDAQAVVDAQDNITVFAINRSLEEQLEMSLELRGFEGYSVKKHIVLTADDPKATNTEDTPDAVKPAENGNARCENGCVKAVLDKVSWNVICLSK